MGILRVSFIAVATMLTACEESPAPQSAEQRAAIVEAATTRLPANPVLAEKYERSCKSCHADPENAAPLSGDIRAWAPRLEARGADGLLDSSLDGFGGMPPLGGCLDCSIEDFNKLIAFMAGEDR